MARSIGSLTSWSSAIALVSLTAALWSCLIDAIVPDPYLDEVFHVGQAHAYLRGQWEIWDPKLTTPPGLYLASWILWKPPLALGLRHVFTDILTDASALRFTNIIGSVLLAWLVRSLLLLNIEVRDGNCGRKHESNVRCKRCPNWSGWELIHTTINVYLFPPLFFFYGLYYTDVLSALSVLYAYRCYLAKQQTRVLFAGLLSLLFRQTNIFWVSFFLGGLELCRTIPKGRPEIEFPSQPTFYDVIEGSWQHASAYDPLISQACFEDYIKTGISYAIAGLTNFSTVMWSMSSYLVILCAFAEFVFWNGGVVLGDKENHVASLHLTQMIYIWPYFAFFSWPLLYPQYHLALAQPIFPVRITKGKISATTMAVMLVVIRYNTIVHPFTLADNRHYMFYVFRILLRHPSIKYLAVLIYIDCAWDTLSALSWLPTARSAPQQETSPRKRKFREEEPFPPSPQLNPSPMKRSKSQESILPPSLRPILSSRMTEMPKFAIPPPPPKKQKKQKKKKKQISGHRASFTLIWLLATALSIITTPLVEPRYLIVPWLIWRLHMAIPRPGRPSAPATRPDTMRKRFCEALKAALYERHDHRLWLETVWFLAINLATGYIFLYWGFEWPQEPGKVQRFMW